MTTFDKICTVHAKIRSKGEPAHIEDRVPGSKASGGKWVGKESQVYVRLFSRHLEDSELLSFLYFLLKYELLDSDRQGKIELYCHRTQIQIFHQYPDILALISNQLKEKTGDEDDPGVQSFILDAEVRSTVSNQAKMARRVNIDLRN